MQKGCGAEEKAFQAGLGGFGKMGISCDDGFQNHSQAEHSAKA